MHLTTAHTKNPYMAGKPASENHPRVKAGVLLWKGYEMKKYIPVDFDEKGNVILGRERNTPTSNGFIPTTWVPGGGGSGDEGSGLKSIRISPVLSTEPTLDSLYPIYWDDLTEEEKEEGKKTVLLNADSLTAGDTYTAQATATGDWYVIGDGGWSAQGGDATYTFEAVQMGDGIAVRFVFGTSADPEDENAEYFELTIGITAAGQ